MKNLIPRNALRFTVALVLTFLFLLINKNSHAQQGEWTWMAGNNFPNGAANYGTQGIFAPTNTPQALFEACEWTDKTGKFWMFGGLDQNGEMLQDLWEFDPYTAQWAWIKGPGITNQVGNYGISGVPSPSNIPGCRSFGAATWVDTAGDLWLFGGDGRSSSTWGNMNDLWRFHIATLEWTWMGGADTANDPGSYGTRLIPATTNLPPKRSNTNAAWADDTYLYLFGGAISNSPNNYSDLWRYDIGNNIWTWMKGSNGYNQSANYGVRGLPDSANHPSARMVWTKWKDHSGNFYFYGGAKGLNVYLNDLWRYNSLANEWTWISGANVANDTSKSSGQCLTSPTDAPAARYESRACWIRPCDNFELFGGIDTGGASGSYNDLWNYSVTNDRWTLINGNLHSGLPGAYGTKGVSSSGNLPPRRYGAISWKDTSGYLWMFGGEQSPIALWNNMWRFVPDTLCPFIPSTNVVSSFVDTPKTACDSIHVYFSNTSNNASYFYWNFGDGNGTSIVNPNHVYNAPGTYYVTLVAMPSCGGNPDTARDTIIVYALPTPVIAPTADTICFYDSVTFNAGVYSFYNWTGGATTQTLTVRNSGIYAVTVTNANGCTNIATRSVYVIPMPTPISSFTCDSASFGCAPLTSKFVNHSSNATSYIWHFGDGSIDTARNPYHTYTSTDSNIYTVYLVAINTGPCGVFRDTSFQNNLIWLNINNPVAAFTSNYSIPIYAGDSIRFRDESTDAYSVISAWHWTFGDTSNSNFMNPIHSWDVPGLYKVELTVTDYKGCRDSTFYKYIEVIEGLVDIPNTFTPNNDGYNDFFEIRASGMEVYHLEIFNRWGMIKFQTTGNHILWDGYDQAGIQCPDGTYYYTLKATGESGKDFSKAGYILLLR